LHATFFRSGESSDDRFLSGSCPKPAVVSRPRLPRAWLFADPSRNDTKVSPDGTSLAWLAPHEGLIRLFVCPVEEPEQATALSPTSDQPVVQFQWAYLAGWLLFVQDAQGDEDYHVFAVEVATGAIRNLTPFAKIRAEIEKLSAKHPQRVLLSYNQRDPRFADLYQVDLVTAERRLLADNYGFQEMVVDSDFVPRLATRGRADGGRDVLRRVADGRWESWWKVAPADARLFHLDHIDVSGRIAYLRDSRGRNTAALLAVDLASGKSHILAQDLWVDIGDIATDPVTLAPIAYVLERERVEWRALDPRVEPDIEFLNARGRGSWKLQSQTSDNRRWIVAAQSDLSPNAEFLYDRNERRLTKLHEAYPQLACAPLQSMSAVTIVARDGLELTGYLSDPGSGAGSRRPLIVVAHGGPWERDHFGFRPVHQWLADRGYAALSVNFRGSTGFGKRLLNAGDGEWGRGMIDDLADAVRWAVARGIADPTRIGIMGGSYGGYATLMSLIRHPDLYACGIDLAGPTELEAFVDAVPPYWEAIRHDLYRAIGNPHTADGWSRLREASPLTHLAAVRRPVLMVHGAHDPRVRKAATDQMVQALKAANVPVSYVVYPDEGHVFRRAANRRSFFAVSECFLAHYLGGRLEPLSREDWQDSSLQIVEDSVGLRSRLEIEEEEK
jgi:dipeptidyl aminopeptidase/acylaminoacyl peptidase